MDEDTSKCEVCRVNKDLLDDEDWEDPAKAGKELFGKDNYMECKLQCNRGELKRTWETLLKVKYTAMILDVVYRMDKIDDEMEYTTDAEFKDILYCFQELNSASTHYTVIVFCSFRQVENFKKLKNYLFWEMSRS